MVRRALRLTVATMLFTALTCHAQNPTSLIRNNMIFSSGTVIQDAPQILLSSPIPDNVPYTSYLDYLVSQGISSPGTLNIYVDRDRFFKTGPYSGAVKGGVEYRGVKGLPSGQDSGITFGVPSDSTNDGFRNTYSDAQIGLSALKRSIWMKHDGTVFSINAYRNVDQLLEPSTTQALGLNVARSSNSGGGSGHTHDAGSAGDVEIGTSIKIKQGGTYSTVVVGGGDETVLPNGGLKVNGDLTMTGSLFGRIGDVVATSNVDETNSVATPTEFDTKLIDLTASKYQFNNTSGVTLKGFILVSGIIKVVSTGDGYTWAMTTEVYETTNLVTPVATSQPSKFEYGSGNNTCTLINLIPVTFLPVKSYCYKIKITEIVKMDQTALDKCSIQISGYVIPTP